MFNEASIVPCILPLVQFAGPQDPNYTAPDARLTTSITGRQVTSASPLCTIENLRNAAPEFLNYDYPAFAQAVDVKAGKVVEFNNVLYVAKVDIAAINNTANPDVSANFQTTDPFNDWLYNLKYQAAIELITTLFRNRKLANTSKSLLENTRLYENGGLLNDRIINQGAFVGFALELKPNQNIVNYITQIGIQLDSALQNLTIYLFHSSVSAPLATAEITAKGGLTFSWNNVDPNNPLSFKAYDTDPDKGHDTGGIFFLGYYQDDLGQAQAIRRQFNLASGFCQSCNAFEAQAYRKWNKFIKASAILVDAEDLTSGDPKLWDVTKTQWMYNTNWGLNCAFSVTCDVTSFICANARLFADAYAQLVAVKCCEQMATSTRINGISAQLKQLAATELDPTKGSGSLRANYIDAMGAIDIDVSGFDENCLPCSDKGKIYWGDSI